MNGRVGNVGAERYLRFAPDFGWPIPRYPRLPLPRLRGRALARSPALFRDSDRGSRRPRGERKGIAGGDCHTLLFLRRPTITDGCDGDTRRPPEQVESNNFMFMPHFRRS